MGKIIKSTGSNYVPDKVNQYMSFNFHLLTKLPKPIPVTAFRR